MVDPLRDRFDLLFQTQSVLIAEPEFGRHFAQAHDFFGQRHAAFAALHPDFGEDHVHAEGPALFLHQGQFGLGVVREAVDGHDGGQAVDLRDVLHVLQQVGQTLFQGGQIFVLQLRLRQAAVHLERAHRGDDHDRGGGQARHAALDVQEFLRAQVRAEAGLGHHVVAGLQGHAGRGDGVAAVRDVGERAAVHERGRVLQRLHQIGF